jgi:hypothetical protein
MTTLRPLPMRITPRQYERLTQARERDGLTVQEHVRRALDHYLTFVEKEARKPMAMAAQDANIAAQAEQSQAADESRLAPRLRMR